MHPTSIKPHLDAVDFTRIELEAADIDFDTLDATKLVNGEGNRMYRPRTVFVTNTGGGTLVCTTDVGTERVFHNLSAGKYLDPSPLVISGTKTSDTAGDVGKFILVDDDSQTSTFTGWADDTTDANDTGTADVLFMPATEATADGFLVGMSKPFNALDINLSTSGVGGVITWKYYTGDRTTYDATWTDLTKVTGAGKNLLQATGSAAEVQWLVPADWVPCNINSYGDLYWVYGNVSTVFTTNPAGTQVQAKNVTNVFSS